MIESFFAGLIMGSIHSGTPCFMPPRRGRGGKGWNRQFRAGRSHADRGRVGLHYHRSDRQRLLGGNGGGCRRRLFNLLFGFL